MPTLEMLIEEFIKDVRDLSNYNDVAIRIFIGTDSHSVEFDKRTPAELKSAGISMKNLRGEWIKEPQP